MFVKGKSYLRRDLHERYGGQEQTGISTPADYPMIFLFTSKKAEKYGYRDGWTNEGVFLFFGRPPYLEDRLESMNGLLTFDMR